MIENAFKSALESVGLAVNGVIWLGRRRFDDLKTSSSGLRQVRIGAAGQMGGPTSSNAVLNAGFSVVRS